MALTFDDLPFVGAGQPYFPAATQTTAELLRVLRRHRAPAIGFVNEGQLDAGGERQSAREALLRQWSRCGHDAREPHVLTSRLQRADD
jgi:peptidoglycan/xylan/chitin deacetylase (PgdA/CDA1 family)